MKNLLENFKFSEPYIEDITRRRKNTTFISSGKNTKEETNHVLAFVTQNG